MTELDKIQKVISNLKVKGEEFTFKNYTDRNDGKEFGGDPNSNWESWCKRIKALLDQTVLENSEPYRYYAEANSIPLKGYLITNFQNAKDNYLKALSSLENVLIEGDYFNELIDKTVISLSDTVENKQKSIEKGSKKNKVFIVHGHDHNLKIELEIFLSKMQLEPIVLHREIDGGQTIIEKFESNSDVAFVFILLTPDEIAYTADQLEKEDHEREKEFRARPNVIFEFGFFVGKLGRRKVCALHKGNVALPSDLNGVIYKKVEKSIEDIGFALIKELKAAGLTITI